MPFRMWSFPRSLLTLVAAALLPILIQAQGRPGEQVNFIKDAGRLPDVALQAELRAADPWRSFTGSHARWSVEFNESSGKPHRAYGPPITTTGADPELRALHFIGEELAIFGIPMDELVHVRTTTTAKYHFVRFSQEHQGLPVIQAHLLVKLDLLGSVVLFGIEVHDDIDLVLQPSIGSEEASGIASEGLLDVESVEVNGLRILPIPAEGRTDHRLVHELMVHTRKVGMVGHHRCWVDAHNGELLYRWNEVRSGCHGHAGGDNGAEVQVEGTIQVNGPLQPGEVHGMPNLRVTVNGDVLFTDDEGYLDTDVPGPVSAGFELRGLWSTVVTDNSTPSFITSLAEGPNTISFDAASTLRQRTAYFAVDRMHAHMKTIIPDPIGLDIALTTRVDVTGGNCNANYDYLDTSINFFAEGNGCRSFALLPDVVYHEYGHGINDKFYQSIGGSFLNAAMHEGYADLWSMSLTLDPVIAQGYLIGDDGSYFRRYDQNPKVYPLDLVGQMHADGEIIGGAWWDTHVLLGNNMVLMMQLFAEAYPGLQAAAFNGQEGQAFRDVLIDALQADDDDSDITNGTPNGAAIVEGFARHGITLLSNAQIQHTPLEAAVQDEPMTITAAVNVFFPDDQYLGSVRLFHRVNNATDWTSEAMMPVAGGVYTAALSAQTAGTLVSYFLAVEDVLGGLGAALPKGAERADPNVPFHILVGFELQATEDGDQVHELGEWTTGIAQDNATAGMWELAEPVPSHSGVNGTGVMVQPGSQHTPGGSMCWVTQNAPGPFTPMGAADVDGGSTTIESSIMDLSTFDTPTFSYWRWYVNNPPGGSNPGEDLWQVFISNDAGSTWVPVEETSISDRSWRRVTFRVEDVIDVTATMRLRFVASDSVVPGANQAGASLVEAALDDIQLWEASSSTVGLSEQYMSPIASLYPDPANDVLNVVLTDDDALVLYMEVLDVSGRMMTRTPVVHIGGNRHRIDVQGLAAGQYILRLVQDRGHAHQRFNVMR